MSFKTSQTDPRFAWKKRPEWMPIDVPWPAPGKKVVFTYSGTDQLISHLLDTPVTDKGRTSLFLETDFRFGRRSNDNLYSSSIAWNEDSLNKTQVNYELQTPLLLEAYPKLAPIISLFQGGFGGFSVETV